MPAEPGDHPPDAADGLAARVQSVLGAAEREAAALREEVEHVAEARATEILLEAEREGQRMLAKADELARAHLDDTRSRLDAYAADRIQRMHAVTERLLTASDGLADRFDEALETRRALADLLGALGAAAEQVAAEVRGPLPPVPPPPRPPMPQEPASS